MGAPHYEETRITAFDMSPRTVAILAEPLIKRFPLIERIGKALSHQFSETALSEILNARKGIQEPRVPTIEHTLKKKQFALADTLPVGAIRRRRISQRLRLKEPTPGKDAQAEAGLRTTLSSLLPRPPASPAKPSPPKKSKDSPSPIDITPPIPLIKESAKPLEPIPLTGVEKSEELHVPPIKATTSIPLPGTSEKIPILIRFQNQEAIPRPSRKPLNYPRPPKNIPLSAESGETENRPPGTLESTKCLKWDKVSRKAALSKTAQIPFAHPGATPLIELLEKKGIPVSFETSDLSVGGPTVPGTISGDSRKIFAHCPACRAEVTHLWGQSWPLGRAVARYSNCPNLTCEQRSYIIVAVSRKPSSADQQMT